MHHLTITRLFAAVVFTSAVLCSCSSDTSQGTSGTPPCSGQTGLTDGTPCDDACQCAGGEHGDPNMPGECVDVSGFFGDTGVSSPTGKVCGSNAGTSGGQQCDGPDSFAIANMSDVWQNAGSCPGCTPPDHAYTMLCNGVSTAVLGAPCVAAPDYACSQDRTQQLVCVGETYVSATWQLAKTCGGATCTNYQPGTPQCAGPNPCPGCP